MELYEVEKVQRLGTFTLGNDLIVCDPCYGSLDSNLVSVKSCIAGTWIADIGLNEEGRVVWLSAVHENFKGKAKISYSRSPHYIAIPVDSGQAGIFDLEQYKKIQGTHHDDEFYDECCKVTIDTPAGIVHKISGVCSSSGYGDGSYSVMTWCPEYSAVSGYSGRNKSIGAVFIEFIGEEY